MAEGAVRERRAAHPASRSGELVAHPRRLDIAPLRHAEELQSREHPLGDEVFHLTTRYLQARAKRAGEVHWIDAREIVQIDQAPLGPSILWPESRANADRLIPRAPSATLVITGSVARTRDGLQTTLGRNGSDFSGSIFGALLDASEIVIWTDVDGVLSADPRRVPDATIKPPCRPAPGPMSSK